jgi:signal peptidase I
MRESRHVVLLFARPLLIAVGAAALIRLTCFQIFSVPSESMSPALRPGDQIVVTPYRSPFGQRPERGDVIVFRRAASDFYVKRVIAAPGDHVEVLERFIRVNGVTVAEPYVRHEGNGRFGPEIVPADSYFVLGDNRANSIDSRSWGYVSGGQICGRARMVLWSSRRGAEPVANASSRDDGNVPSLPADSGRLFLVIK